MTNITPAMIKELREATGVGMRKCKNALVESGGDVQKAIDILRKAGMASAVKKEGRATKEGLIGTAEDNSTLVIVEANAETDFVVQNEKFGQFVHELCAQALDKKPASLEDFLNEPYIKDPSITIEQSRNLMVQSFGENVIIKRLAILPKTSDSSIGVYSHMGGKIVCVVELAGASGLEELAKSIAMHVAAEAPEYLTPNDVPQDVKEREEDIAKAQVKGKPENMIDKIVAGKYKAFCDQTCLVSQKYIKDNSKTVEAVVAEEAKKLGKDVTIKSFIRWQVGV